MILKIVGSKDPVLRQIAKPVETVDKKITTLIADMVETLEAQIEPEGVGLAAPQVGKSLRIFVVNYQRLKRVVINPKVVSIGDIAKPSKKAKNDLLEGCLSLAHYYAPITRPATITISYTDVEGNTQEETFKDFDAQIIQHELDHLNGKLFIDKVLGEKLPLYKFDGKEWEEVSL